MKIPSGVHFEVIPDEALLPLPDVHIDIATHDLASSLAFLDKVRFHDRVTFDLPARLIKDKEELEMVLDRLLHVHEVLVIAGDEETPWGPYEGALDILPRVRERFKGKIGVATYPEGHPFVADSLAQLQKKLKFADFIVTQICEHPTKIDDHIRELREAGIMQPIRLGLLGISDAQSFRFIKRYSRITHVEIGLTLQEVTGHSSILFSCFTDVLPTLAFLEEHPELIEGFHE